MKLFLAIIALCAVALAVVNGLSCYAGVSGILKTKVECNKTSNFCTRLTSNARGTQYAACDNYSVCKKAGSFNTTAYFVECCDTDYCNDIDETLGFNLPEVN